MLDRAIRWLKRSIILLPGLLAAYFAVYDIFPIIDRRVPADLAFIVTYIVTAYAVIPAGIRLFRLIFKAKHLPYYSVTPDGLACDPINIGLIGTKQEITEAMESIGWHQADKRTLMNIAKMAASIVLRRPYPNAPFSNLYLLGRSQDIGFQLPVDDNPLHRHHVRFWAIAHPAEEEFEEHVSFWQRHTADLKPDRLLWVGAGSLDTGISFVRHTGQITHMIHHDTNAERELIVSQLKKAKRIKRSKSIQIGKPYQLVNRVWRGYMHSDGKMTVVDLKDS